MSNKPNKRKIQAEERRLQILDTAVYVFAEKGFSNTSIKDLAEAAGISTGLMYHYFKSKEKLFEEAVEFNSFLPQLRDILKDTKNQSYRDVFQSVTLRFIDLLEQKSGLVKIFIQEGYSNLTVQQVWKALVNEGVSLSREYIDERIAAGDFRHHNSEVMARCLLSNIVMYHLTKSFFQTSGITRDQFVSAMLDNLFQGIEKS